MFWQLLKRIVLLAVLAPVSSVAQSSDRYSRIDAQYAKAPRSETKDLEGLAHYLTNNLSGEDEKVRSIFTWICHNIKYDYKSYQKCRNVTYTPEKVLKSRKAMCEGYAILFKAMCDAIHITCTKLDGYAKTDEYDTYNHFYEPDHSWNAVLVNGKWQLVDATWAAGAVGVKHTRVRKIIHKVFHKVKLYGHKPGFVFDYNDAYFFTPAYEFILDHAPIDPVWQLLPSEVPIFVYEKDDESITKYERDNAIISGLLRNTEFEDPASKEIDIIKKVCDRAYGYNYKFNTIMAIKEVAIADQIVTDSISDKNPLLVYRAKLHYNAAIEYLKCSKTAIDEKYRELQATNTAKKKMLTDENKVLKRINTFIENKAKSNYAGGKKSLETMEMALDEASYKDAPVINGITVQGSSSDNKTVEDRNKLLLTLQDSRKQIRALRLAIEQNKSKVRKWKLLVAADIDSIKYGVENGDSLIYHEEVLRVSMYDSYKKQIKAVRNPLMRIKQNVDSVYGHLLYEHADSIKRTERDISTDLKKIKQQLKSETVQIKQNQQLTNTELIRWLNQDIDSLTSVDAEINTRLSYQVEFMQAIVPIYSPIYLAYKQQDNAFKFEEKVEKKRCEKIKHRFELKKKKEIENNKKNIEIIKKKIDALKEFK